MFSLQKKAKGSDLLDQVFQHVELSEKDYFGLQFVQQPGDVVVSFTRFIQSEDYTFLILLYLCSDGSIQTNPYANNGSPAAVSMVVAAAAATANRRHFNFASNFTLPIRVVCKKSTRVINSIYKLNVTSFKANWLVR